MQAALDRKGNASMNRFNTPEGVEGFSRVEMLEEAQAMVAVSIPRRVLRGFRASTRLWTPAFSYMLQRWVWFQYPGGC